MPAAMMLSNTLVHSSGVKVIHLLAMAVSNQRGVLARYFCCLITSKFAPEDVIALTFRSTVLSGSSNQ